MNVRVPDPDADEQLTQLLADLQQAWAETEMGDEIKTFAGYLRAAYGAGYIRALEERKP